MSGRSGCLGAAQRRGGAGRGGPSRRLALGLWAAVATAGLGGAGPARAHEFRPALLTITEGVEGSFSATLVAPAGGEGVTPRWPEGCAAVEVAAAAGTRAWAGRCGEGGLRGRLSAAGLSEAAPEVVVRVRRAGGAEEHGVLRAGSPTLALGEEGAGGAAVGGAAGYVGLGVEHIVGGVDHLLFVAGLVMLVLGTCPMGRTEARRRGWGLAAALTAFTAAHSVTLAAASVGALRVPAAPVEACIALSIVALAREVALARGAGGRGGARAWGFAFACGLIHGLGFAGALAEVGLPRDAAVAALVAFNVGVELGQVAAAAAVAAAVTAATRALPGRGAALGAGAGYALGAVATAWTIERALGLGG